MGRAERIESELGSLSDWIERYFISRDLLPPPAIAAGVASARAALALPADEAPPGDAAASIRALPLPERGAPFAYGVVDGCGDKWDVFRDRVTADFCAANCNAVVTHGKGRPGPFRVVPLYPHPTPRAEAASAVPAWRDSFPPTHYCRECKALWRRWPDGSWSLVTMSCGKCCDNVAMGEQIVALGEACTAPASAEAVAREAADLLAEMDAAWPPSQPPAHPKSFQGRFQARVRAVAHALRVRGGR